MSFSIVITGPDDLDPASAEELANKAHEAFQAFIDSVGPDSIGYAVFQSEFHGLQNPIASTQDGAGQGVPTQPLPVNPADGATAPATDGTTAPATDGTTAPQTDATDVPPAPAVGHPDGTNVPGN